MNKEDLIIGKYYYIPVVDSMWPSIYRSRLNEFDNKKKKFEFSSRQGNYKYDFVYVPESEIDRIQSTAKKAHTQLVKMLKKIDYDAYLEVKEK